MLYVNIISFRAETLFCWSVSSEWREREWSKNGGKKERREEGEEGGEVERDRKRERRVKGGKKEEVNVNVHVHFPTSYSTA